MADRSLAKKLELLLSGGFFRPLSRPTVYVDCAERLIETADEGGQVLHGEARLLIPEVLLRHPDVQLAEDEGGSAAQFFNKLIEAHWIEPRRVSLDEHHVLITPPLPRLLRLLRELAEDCPAELKDFAVTLRSLCVDLLREGALDPNRLGPEEMRQTMKDLFDRAERAEEQMHMVETLILRFCGRKRRSVRAPQPSRCRRTS